VRLKASVFREKPVAAFEAEGALTLMAVAGTETEQAADGAVTEQAGVDERRPIDVMEPAVVVQAGVDERSPTEGNEPAVMAGVDERSPTEGREPIVNGIVARKGDSALLLQRGFKVTERATSCGLRSSNVRPLLASSQVVAADAVDARRIVCPHDRTRSVIVRISGTSFTALPLMLLARLVESRSRTTAFSNCHTTDASRLSHSCKTMGMKFSLLRKGLTKFSSKFSNVRTEFTSGDRISPKAVRARVTCLETGVRKTGVGVALDVVQGDGGSVMGCLEEMMEVPSACNAGAVSDRRHRAKSEEPMCLIGVACGVLFGVGFGVGRGVWTTGCGVCAMLSFNTCAARGAAVAPKGSEPGKAGIRAAGTLVPSPSFTGV